MADRQVTKTGKDNDGDITSLCNDGSAWSPVPKSQAISDIEGNVHTYHVQWPNARTEIKVVHDPSVNGGKYLRTDRDSTSSNNLDDLPDC
jgi:hypothetical protein